MKPLSGTLGFGLVGTGVIAHNHAQAILALAEIRASQSRNADAAALLLRARASLDALESPSESTEAFYVKIRDRICTEASLATKPPCA